MTTAAIYARLSDDKRAGTPDEGKSVDEQISLCREFIARRGWEVGVIYRDDSISATDDSERPGFEQLLLDKPATVVAFKQDRLTRGTLETLRLQDAGVTGWFCDGSKLSFDTADEEMMTYFRTAIDQNEGRKKAERIKAANRRIANAGAYRGSIRPFGQRRNGDWVEEEAAEVREAVPKIISREWSFYRTSVIWNERGLLTPRTGKQGGREWTSGTVRQFFTRPRLYGYQEYEGTLYPLRDWDSLLSKEEFDAIQLIIDTKKTGRRGESKTRRDSKLLTGIIRCECGRSMNVGYKRPGDPGRIYRCPTSKHQTVTAPPVEHDVREGVMLMLSAHEEYRKIITDTQQQLKELSVKRAELEVAHQQWMAEAVEVGLPPGAMRGRMDAHAVQLAEIDAERFALEQERGLDIVPDSSDQSESEKWDATPMEKRRELVASVIEWVKVARGGQGQRFDPARLSYKYTPLGEKLLERWVEWQLEGETPQISTGPQKRPGKQIPYGEW